MKKPALLLAIAIPALPPVHQAQTLDNAEVRIPYVELKQLLARATPAAKPESPKPALLSARLKLSLENELPVIDANFRTTSFSTDVTLIPLVSGDLSLDTQEPEDAAIITEGNSLCLANDRTGTRTLNLRMLPVAGVQGFSISFPPCPSVIFETRELPSGHSVVVKSGNLEKTLTGAGIHPLPNSGNPVNIRVLNDRETREAMSPPEPSVWTWQHQALVKPTDSDLAYQIVARASASEGSGVEARLPLPQDAQDVLATGDDIASLSRIRGKNRSQELAIAWKTRGILDRQLVISYRMPLRPLDLVWHLESPGGDGTRTRFIIATSPVLSYSSNGLSGPLTSQGLPSVLADSLKGATCQHLEAAVAADLKVTPIPVAATAEGVVRSAEWALKIEPDGAMLTTGCLVIENKTPLGLLFDTPEGMKLLSCDIAGKPVSPVDLGGGTLKVTLPAAGDATQLNCSFSGRTTDLDPVEGTLKLTLPKIPLFTHALAWRIDMPSGYQAETHGNLQRSNGADPSHITLHKNLCRDERPEIRVFYQRSDLNR